MKCGRWKVPEPYIVQMEENMAKGLPAFELKGQLPADKGQMDMTLHFKQSGQSDYYYFNKYDLAFKRQGQTAGSRPAIRGHPHREKTTGN